MNDIVTAVFLIAGGIFSFIASLGMLRLPDTIIRMHAATKAGALGAGLILIAQAFYHYELATTLRALAAVTFVLLTAPVAAHLIGRAAYCSKVTLWEKTWIDELANTCNWRVSEFEPDKNSKPEVPDSKE